MVFLETTIQADRNFSHRANRNKIKESLDGKELISSTYVIGELINNFLKNTIAFYTLLVESETTNEALSRFGEKFYSTRQYNRIIKIFSSITEDGNMQKEDVLDRLDILIEDTMINRFQNDLNILSNETKCTRAVTRPIKEDGLWHIKFECRKKPKPLCKIKEFIDKNKITFEAIETIDAKSLENCINLIKKINCGEELPYGKACWNIGDAIICHESPNEALIFTTNKKDFDPICQTIGKKLFVI